MNMSYCRFRNTLAALEECLDAMQDGNLVLPYEEYQAFRRMVDACDLFLQEADMVKGLT